MGKDIRTLAGMSADEAVAYVMDNDISDLLDQAEVVRERRPATMVNAVRVDPETQIRVGGGRSGAGDRRDDLMRQIIEEWVQANRQTGPVTNQRTR